MENASAYQSITTLQGVLEYLDKVDGFRDFSLGRMNYDSAFQMFSVGIEEVLEGDNWPEESNGRVWYLKFGSVSNIKIDVDAPTGLWASDMYMSDEGNFIIESNQGTITITAGVIELQVPAGAEDGIETQTSAADNAPLNFKGLFNDIKNTITGKNNQPTAQPEAQPAPEPEAQPAPVEQPIQPTEVAQPAPVQEMPAQPVAPVSEPIAAQPAAPAEPTPVLTEPIQPDNSGIMPGGPVFG